MPTSCGTITSEKIILLRHVATKAMGTNKIFTFVIFALRHAFLCNCRNISKQPNVWLKGFSMIVVHENLRNRRLANLYPTGNHALRL